MVIPQIIRIHLTQSPIPLSPLPHPVLPLNKPKQRRTRRSANPQHSQTHPIPRRIPRRLIPHKNIRSDDAPDIAEADLHRGSNTTFVVPGHEVGHPDQYDRLGDVPPRHDEEKSEVLYACGEVVLGEEDDVPHGRDDETEDTEPVSMSDTICAPRRNHRGNSRNAKNRDTADLRHTRRIP